MTGREILNKSLQLLGYTENNGNTHLTQITRNRALPTINLVYAELSRNCGVENTPLNSLSEEINLPDRVLNEIMPCGVAMYIANAEGDINTQTFWAREYNAKRATLSRLEIVEDTLPKVWG